MIHWIEKKLVKAEEEKMRRNECNCGKWTDNYDGICDTCDKILKEQGLKPT